MNKINQIVTHNGIFHADEVMAVAIIRILKPELQVVRTRDPVVIENSLIAVDVGDVYEDYALRFDHHQRAGAGERPNGIPYSSCGLVWDNFGRGVCGNYFEPLLDIQALFEMVDSGLISAIDLIDCRGSKALGIPEGIPFFSISQVISGFNGTEDSEDAAFEKAVTFAGSVLNNELRRCAEVVKSQRQLEEYMDECRGSQILVLPTFIPGWAQSGKVKDAGFTRVVFQDVSGSWRCQAVPDTTLLPEEWGGLNGDDLAEQCGVTDSVFCHRGRFIAGARSREGALAMARRSL